MKDSNPTDVVTQGTPLVGNTTRDTNRDAQICFACSSSKMASIGNIIDHHAGTGRRYTLGVCQRCGSARLLNALSKQQLEELYPPTFYSYDVAKRRHWLLEAADRWRYDRHRFRPRFERLLEVGSGCGEFLQTIKDRGEVVGLERSPAARAKAQEAGLDVRVGDVADSAFFQAGTFDYAYLSHSFEHLDDPSAALASLREWLTTGGRLFIAVPNFAGLLPRLFSKSWYNLALPLHVSQFTPRGIRLLLEHNGFEVESIAYNSDPVSIPMTICFASGVSVLSTALLQRLITLLSLLCLPISRLLDSVALGDCIEIHARKRE